MPTEIRGIGAEASHTDAHRIERLAEGTEQHVGCHLREVGLEKELYSRNGIWQQARRHHQHQQQDEERGHEHLGCPLDAVAHSMLDDEMSDAKDSHGPHNRFDGMGREIGEILLEILRVAIEMPHERCIDILQTPSRHHCIIARDEESREHTQAAHCRPYPRR